MQVCLRNRQTTPLCAAADFHSVEGIDAKGRIARRVSRTGWITAGVRVGDVITEIDGVSTVPMSLNEFAELMRRPAEQFAMARRARQP